MKKLFVMLAMLTMTLAANAQFEKGKTYVAADLTGLNFSYNGGNKWSIGISANVGTFVKDNWLVYGKLGYDHKGRVEPAVDKAYNNFSAGAGFRYYILQNGLFLGANAKYAYDTVLKNDFRPAIEVGYAFFVSKEVTIEPALYYEQSVVNHSNNSTVGLKLGIGLYHTKKNWKEAAKVAFEK